MKFLKILDFFKHYSFLIKIILTLVLVAYSAIQSKRANNQEELKIKAELELVKAADAFNQTLISRDIKSKADAVSKYKYKEVVKRNIKLQKLLKQRKEVVHEKDCKYVPYIIDISVK